MTTEKKSSERAVCVCVCDCGKRSDKINIGKWALKLVCVSALYLLYKTIFPFLCCVDEHKRERTEIGRANPFCQELIIIIADFTVELLKFFLRASPFMSSSPPLPISSWRSTDDNKTDPLVGHHQTSYCWPLLGGRDPAIQPPLLVDLFNLEKNVLF